MAEQNADKVFTLDNLPSDAVVFTGQGGNYEPVDDSQIYQCEVSKVELRQNPFWKETPENATEEEKAKAGSKYQFNFTFTILDEGEYRGRKLWATTSLALKPTTKGGKGEPTVLYKIVTKVMNTAFTWDDCQSFGADIKTLFSNLLENIVGKQVKVSIENVTNADTKKTKSKIRAYFSVKNELPKYVPEDRDAAAERIFTDPETGEDVEASIPSDFIDEPKDKKAKKK